MMTSQITIKTTPKARRLLRMVAAQTGEKQYQVLERLLSDEWSSLEAGASREQAVRPTPWEAEAIPRGARRRGGV